MLGRIVSKGLKIRVFTGRNEAQIFARNFKGRIVDCQRTGYLVLTAVGIIVDADGKLSRDESLLTAGDLLMPADASLALAALSGADAGPNSEHVAPAIN